MVLKKHYKKTIFYVLVILVFLFAIKNKVMMTGSYIKDKIDVGIITNFYQPFSYSTDKSNTFVSHNNLLTASNQSENWLMVHGDYGQHRFFKNDSINHINVRGLELLFTINVGPDGPLQAAPIVVNGKMYVTSINNVVWAVDAKTGKKLWVYKYLNNSFTTCCGPVNRGLAISQDRLFMATIDGHLISLDANTGKLIWKKNILDDSEKLSVVSCTAAPTVFEDKIFVGCSHARGFIRAFNAINGNLLWGFYTIPDKGQQGVWATHDATGHYLGRNITQEKKVLDPKNVALGGSVWGSPAIDVKTRTIYFVTGDPLPFMNGKLHPGDNLFSESLLALDIETGRYKWHYQYIPHDIWDLDFSAPVILGSAKNNAGELIPAIFTSGKIGNIFVHDRSTGKLIRFSEPMINQRLWESEKESFESMPNGLSGVTWSPMAFDSSLRLVFAMNSVFHELLVEKDKLDIPPHTTKHSYTGRLAAVDIDTGKITWKFDTPKPLVGGGVGNIRRNNFFWAR